MRYAWGHRCDVCKRRILGRGIVMVSLELKDAIVEGLPREVAVHRRCLRPVKWPAQLHGEQDVDDEPLAELMKKY